MILDYTEVVKVATQILIMAGLISLVVSLLTEFLIKKFFKLNTKALNGIILGLSEALTLLSGVIYIQIKSAHPVWYVWVGIVFLGFLVSIIAMNGYDKIFSYIYEYLKDIFRKED